MDSNNRLDVPVALFIFRRLDTVKMIMQVLQKIKPSVLYVFSDAARNGLDQEKQMVESVRDYVDSAVNWDCQFNREYADINLGCSANINRGFDKVLNEYGKGIFLEDDAVPRPEFFTYCSDLLDKYEDNKRIQYIAGFNGIGDNRIITDSYTFSTTAPMSGAIATWNDRWVNVDSKINSWKNGRDGLSVSAVRKEIKKRWVINEAYIFYKKIYDEIISGKIKGEWDVVFGYDMLDKDRYAVVPKINLVKSYGYVEGAFHVQERKVAEKLKKVMDYSNEPFVFPMNEPKEIVWNIEYDKKRMQTFLDVQGSFIERKIKNIKQSIKDMAYKTLSEDSWNKLKRILKK